MDTARTTIVTETFSVDGSDMQPSVLPRLIIGKVGELEEQGDVDQDIV